MSSDPGADTDWLADAPILLMCRWTGAHSCVWQMWGEEAAASTTCFCLCRSGGPGLQGQPATMGPHSKHLLNNSLLSLRVLVLKYNIK